MSALPPPGPHGGDGAAVARALGLAPDQVLDLSTTLNPLAADPAPIVARHLDALGRYPDPSRATAALAAVLGVPVDRLVLTNGGAEAIALAGRFLGGWVEEPDFALYPRGEAEAPLPGIGPIEAPRWRSNPRSPTGELAPSRTAGAPDPGGAPRRPDPPGLAVWDEAFWPLATGTWSRGDDRHGDVVVGSLTKLLACPGLRAGYLVVPDGDLGRALATAVRAAQPEWSVGGLACEALPDLLATVDLAGWADALAEVRRDLADRCAGAGLAVVGGGPTWLLVSGDDLRSRLAPLGVVVRDAASFGLHGTVRIGLPRPADLPHVAAALDRLTPA